MTTRLVTPPTRRPITTRLCNLEPDADLHLRYGLVDAWNCDEASGNLIGNYAGLTFTDTNTVGSAAGLIGTSRLHVRASSEYFTRADDAIFSPGDVDWWWAGWLYRNSIGVTQDFISKTAASNSEYTLELTSGNLLRLYVSGDGTANTTLSNANQTITDAVWTFFLAWHDSVANTINSRVNHGTVASAAHTTGTFNGTAALTIGRHTSAGQHYDGRLDCLAFGKAPPLGLTALADELSSFLYNGGAGRAWPW